MKKSLLFLLAAVMLLSGCGRVRVVELTTEQLSNPLNVHSNAPRLGWVIESDKNDVMQTSYHVLVATSPRLLKPGKADLWDSEVVESSQSLWVPYKGVELTSGQHVYWRVKVTTTAGDSRWSEPAEWSMGLLTEADWRGQWIGNDGYDYDSTRRCNTRALDGEVYNDTVMLLNARYLRQEFTTGGKKVERAVAHICGLGLYELYINGDRVGQDVLTPGATDWRKSVIYNSYDVTNMLQEENAVGVILGCGRYVPWRPSHMIGDDDMYGFPKLRMQIDISYTDGTMQSFASDTLWRMTNRGPIRFNHEYDGEDYDARLELGDWAKCGYDDSGWMHCRLAQSPKGALVGNTNENMRVMQTLAAANITDCGDGRYIVDFGQNLAGWPVVKLHDLSAGDTVTMRFAEILNGDSLYVANLRSALATDHYYASGKENGTAYHVRFITHGFRYMEISGMPKAALQDFSAELVYDNVATIGAFECSNNTLNAVLRNAWWGIADNYKGMPMDCCQRDERMPWLGDRTAGCYGEGFLFGIGNLYGKWMADICQAQDTNGNLPSVAPRYWNIAPPNMTWPAALPMGCDMLYQYYGNLKPMADSYDAIARWMDYMMNAHMNADSIITQDRWGDWCMPPETQHLIHSEDPDRITDGALMSTAYYVKVSQMLAFYAPLVGRQDDVEKWQSRQVLFTRSFNRAFLKADVDSVKGVKACYANNTATSNVLPLAFGMVPEQYKAAVQKSLIDKIMYDNKGHVSCGVVGMSWLQRLLTSMGESNLAFALATNTTWPSFGYMIDKGATTIWELWNGDTADPEMNSANHVMLLGDLIQWVYKDLGGIKPDAPGFKQIRLSPDFSVKDLDWVKCSYRTLYGTIESNYRRTDNGQREWQVRVPCNTTATVVLPDGEKQVGSGSYTFVF